MDSCAVDLPHTVESNAIVSHDIHDLILLAKATGPSSFGPDPFAGGVLEFQTLTLTFAAIPGIIVSGFC